jgi:hypothetical protein
MSRMLQRETRRPDPPRYGPLDAVPITTCLNCDAELVGPYCARCGQKRPLIDLSLREFLHETTQEVTHWEGKVPATLKTLFTKPGLLTLDFLEGRRARWLPPLRLYLICSVAYFLSGPIVEAISHRSAREVAKITLTNPDGSTTLTPEGRAQIEQSLPGRLFGRERLERAVANSDKLNRAIETAYPKAMVVLLPLFAFLTRLAWRRKMPHYAAHLYPALHLHSAWFGILAVATLFIPFIESQTVLSTVGFVILAYIVAHSLIALRRVFGDSWGRTIAKAAAVGVAYGICLFAVSLLLLMYALWTI